MLLLGERSETTEPYNRYANLFEEKIYTMNLICRLSEPSVGLVQRPPPPNRGIQRVYNSVKKECDLKILMRVAKH